MLKFTVQTYIIRCSSLSRILLTGVCVSIYHIILFLACHSIEEELRKKKNLYNVHSTLIMSWFTASHYICQIMCRSIEKWTEPVLYNEHYNWFVVSRWTTAHQADRGITSGAILRIWPMRVQYCLYSLAECTLASFLNPPYYLALTVILFTELPPKSRN